MPKWHTEFSCAACQTIVSYRTKMDSHGLCPHCGYRGPGAVTIMHTVDRTYTNVRQAPWWKFWIRPKRVYRQEVTHS